MLSCSRAGHVTPRLRSPASRHKALVWRADKQSKMKHDRRNSAHFCLTSGNDSDRSAARFSGFSDYVSCFHGMFLLTPRKQDNYRKKIEKPRDVLCCKGSLKFTSRKKIAHLRRVLLSLQWPNKGCECQEARKSITVLVEQSQREVRLTKARPSSRGSFLSSCFLSSPRAALWE